MRRGTRRGGAGSPTPPVDRAAAELRLLDGLDAAFDEARRRAGDRLTCAPGCDACCHGPFPITALDRDRLRRGLAALDPARAAAIRERARQAIATLRDGFPGDPDSGRPGSDVERLDAFFAGHAELPCPVLDPASGRCELYDFRPVACRLHGPPLRFRGGSSPHCHLCFVGSSADEVERCRVDVDPRGDEGALLRGERDWATLIAWAVVVGSPAAEDPS